jgi:5-methylcytosine-specific restriction endonuclease McrA
MKKILTYEEVRREALRQMKLHLVQSQLLSKRLVKNIQAYLGVYETKDVKLLINLLIQKYAAENNIVLNVDNAKKVKINNTFIRLNKVVLFSAYEKKCMKCGSIDNIEVDHIYPISVYPEKQNDINNLQLLCKTCNLKKSNKFIVDYRPINKDKNILLFS